jgi:hypothetical protein
LKLKKSILRSLCVIQRGLEAETSKKRLGLSNTQDEVIFRQVCGVLNIPLSLQSMLLDIFRSEIFFDRALFSYSGTAETYKLRFLRVIK